jgi:hypothetical protein
MTDAGSVRYGPWRHERPGREVIALAPHLILRIRLPDRPGALGAVASRIGAVGADITDVVVARSDDGEAVDVFHVNIPDTGVDVIALLTHELLEVDGASLEYWSAGACCSATRTHPVSG